MKIFYLPILILLMTAATYAQRSQDTQIKNENIIINNAPFIKHFQSKYNNKSIESRWYNYAFAVDDVMNSAELNANTLWPDTTIWVKYESGNVASPWIHSMTTILDPVSTWFNDFGNPNLKIYPHMSYSLDSIGYYFLYYRNYIDTSVVDTLIFDIFTKNPDTSQKYHFANHPGFPNVDTVWFLGVDFDPASGDLDFPFTSYTVLLDINTLIDTVSGGFNYVEFPVSGFGQVNAGDKVGVRVRYKPGHNYTPFIDSTSQVNYIRLLAYEEFGNNTYPNYFTGDWNVSSVGRSDTWFDPGSSWYELEVSTFGFVASFPLEDHLINFHLTADYNIGITENKIPDYNLYPNPADEFVFIEFQSNTDYYFEIINITDQIVKKGQILKKTNRIDLSDLIPGMYFINIIHQENLTSKKLLIR